LDRSCPAKKARARPSPSSFPLSIPTNRYLRLAEQALLFLDFFSLLSSLLYLFPPTSFFFFYLFLSQQWNKSARGIQGAIHLPCFFSFFFFQFFFSSSWASRIRGLKRLPSLSFFFSFTLPFRCLLGGMNRKRFLPFLFA